MKLLLSLILMCASIFCTAQAAEEKNFLDSFVTKMPDFKGKEMPLFALNDVNGKMYSNKELAGKVTFINFWFEGCHPCMAEMKALEDLYQKYKPYKTFQFLSITYETKENVKRVFTEKGLSFPALLSTHDDCNRLNFGSGYPTTIIVAKDAKILFFKNSGFIDPDQAAASIKAEIYPVLDEELERRL